MVLVEMGVVLAGTMISSTGGRRVTLFAFGLMGMMILGRVMMAVNGRPESVRANVSRRGRRAHGLLLVRGAGSDDGVAGASRRVRRHRRRHHGWR